MKILGIIPARGGSKGVPGKNIKPFAGEPLIAHTIKAGQNCKQIQRLILSTDDEKIAAVGREYGVEVPFLRPASLATDEATSLSVIQHSLEFVMQEGFYPDLVVVLQPTSPLREAADIENAINLIAQEDYDQVISITKVSQHPYWMKTLDQSFGIEPFMKLEGQSLRRQDLPEVYIPNGAVYVYKRELLLSSDAAPRIGGVIMEEWKSLDIDTPFDFYLAEKVLNGKKQGEFNW